MNNSYKLIENATEEAKTRFMKIPLVNALISGDQTLPKDLLKQIYINFLAQSYYHVRVAPKVYGLAGSRVSDDNEEVRRWLLLHSYEEHGHHEWILSDLKNLDVNPNKVVLGKPNPATSGLIGFMYYTAAQFNPLATLGDSFVIEGLSQLFATVVAKNLGDLGLPKNTLTYLAQHGEADQSHMENLKELINKNVQDQSDLADLIYVANTEYEMYGAIIKSTIPDSEVTLSKSLS